MADDIERVRQAALKDPTQLVRFADLLVAAGRSDEAVQACRKGLSQRPDDVPLRLALGRALSAAGQLEEAQAALLDAVARQQRAAAAPPPSAAPQPPRTPSSPPERKAPAFAAEADSGPVIADPSIEEEIVLPTKVTAAAGLPSSAPSGRGVPAGAGLPSSAPSGRGVPAGGGLPSSAPSGRGVPAGGGLPSSAPSGRGVPAGGGLSDPRTLDDGPTGFEDEAPTSVAAAEEVAKPQRRPIEPQRPLEPGRVTTLPQRNPVRAPETPRDRVTTLPERAPMENARNPRALARTEQAPAPPREEPRRAPPPRPEPGGPVDLRATARALLGDVSADATGHIEDVAPTPMPDEMARAWDARRARSFVWLWVALVLLSGGIAGGYFYRARDRARQQAAAVARADARALEATADGDFAARDAYAGALRADPKARKYAAMVALAAARLAADHGEDTDAAGWAMIKRSDKEAERRKDAPPDPRAERDLRQARALLALGRGEACPPLVDAEDGDIAARCALQRGDTDAARKILADNLGAGDGKNARALLALASLELGAGDLDAADAAFGKVLAAYPGHPRAVIGRIMVAIERGQSPKIPDEPKAVRLGLSTEAWFHLARGLEILNAPPKPGSVEAATAELDSARRGILHDGRLALLYGRARLLQGKVAEAEQAMRVAERLNPNDADVAVLDAEVALAKGYEEKVVAALSVGAQTPRKLAVLGRAQALTGRYKEAAATLDAALAKRPGDAVSITYRAIARSHLGDAAGAQRELEKAATELSSSTAYYGLGLLAFERRDLQRAKTDLEKALAGQNAEAFRARALLGRVLRDLGRTKDALAELERVAREAPALLPVHAALGRLYLDVGRDREARTELRQVLDGGAPTPDDRLAYAEALVHLGAVDQADKAIEDAVQAGVPATRLARLRLELQSWRGPKDALVAAKLLEKDRKGPGARDNELTIATADAYRRAGDLKHASEVLRDALIGEPLRANLGIGRIQLLQGDLTGAETSFRAALDIVQKADSTLGVDAEIEARIGLARALLARKAASEAQALLEVAVEKDPQSAEAHYYLARAYQDKNDFEKARTHADRAIGLDDAYADAWALVGDLAKADHPPRPDRAKEAYKKYLALEPDGERNKTIKKSLAQLK